MTSVVLDSFPTVDIHIPRAANINTSPAYSEKNRRGTNLLGMQAPRPPYFVPMGDTSPHIKKLLKLPEQDKKTVKPIKDSVDISKAKTKTSVVRKKLFR